MSIETRDPNCIHLGGYITEVNTLVADGAITPGMLVERNAGKYRKHATANGAAQPAFALDQSMLNLGVDDAYADGDLVQVGIGAPGSTFWALLVSGGNVADGALLESNGDGYLKAGTDPGQVVARAIEAVNNTAGPGAARIRVEVI
jgi:hypothetical protein